MAAGQRQGGVRATFHESVTPINSFADDRVSGGGLLECAAELAALGKTLAAAQEQGWTLETSGQPGYPEIVLYSLTKSFATREEAEAAVSQAGFDEDFVEYADC